ncbi:hypothetical protein [Magnetovibrio sp.]|uniref:hypothetical protein n=1 Tax=Magnetovibrio sp. TaxID=2024836 RepID=UPI002F93BDFA
MTPPPFLAHVDATKTLVAIVLTALIALGGLVFAWNARGNAQNAGWSSETLVPLGIGVAVFFVMATVSFKSYRTYDQGRSGPIVRIDEAGVLDRRIGATAIPWTAIGGAEIKDISNAKFNRRGDEDERQRPQVMGVVLTVENAAHYMEPDGLLGSAAKTLGQATGHDAIAIDPQGLDTSAEAILQAVKAYLDARQN